jgi:hypothetical protein
MGDFAVAVLTPSTGLCRLKYAMCLARMAMYFSHVRVFEDCDTQYFVPDGTEGSGIAENYERLVEKYLEDKQVRWTHFCSVEDDMGFPPDAIHRLARHRLPIVGANYSTNKGKRQRFTAAGKDKRIITKETSTGLEEVKLLPQGLTLVAREVYEKMAHPWFLMGYSEQNRRYVYQDYYFSQRAMDSGFKLYVDHDLSKLMIHVGSYDYTYKDALRDEALEEKQNGNAA